MNIYVNCITSAVESIISGWDSAVDGGWTVERECEENTDGNRTPWIGIYSPRISFEGTRANVLRPFTATLNIPVIIQDIDYRDVQQSIFNVNDLTAEVYTAVSCYRDLLGTVNIVNGLTWDPFNRLIDDEDVLVSNRLVIIAEVFA